jgi:hypothetical protein
LEPRAICRASSSFLLHGSDVFTRLHGLVSWNSHERHAREGG